MREHSAETNETFRLSVRGLEHYCYVIRQMAEVRIHEISVFFPPSCAISVKLLQAFTRDHVNMSRALPMFSSFLLRPSVVRKGNAILRTTVNREKGNRETVENDHGGHMLLSDNRPLSGSVCF